MVPGERTEPRCHSPSDPEAGEDTRKQEVESESPSPLPKLPLQADALKSSVPESTAVTKKDQRGDGFMTLLSVLKITNVRTQDEFCEVQECR